MNGIVGTVRPQLDERCLVEEICKGKCGVSLLGTNESRVVVDLDKSGAPIGNATRKCDYLFFADPNLAVPLELKDSGTPNVKTVTDQLQAGATKIQELVPGGLNVKFRPVLVSRSPRRRDTTYQLRKAVVEFRNCHERVRLVECGGALTDAIVGQ